MRVVKASDAKTHLPALLDDVEAGETLVITRHGKPIARLVPDVSNREQRVRAAIAEMEALGKANGKVTIEEILSWRHEGHKY